MLSSQSIGHVTHLQERRASALANPHLSGRARAAILGVPYRLPPAKEHRIEVDLRTGERNVISAEPPKAQRINPFVPRALRKRVLVPPPARIGLRRFVIEAVADAWELKQDEIFLKCRKKRISHPRFAAMALIRRALSASTNDIGRTFAMDHTSIMYALQRNDELMVSNAAYARKFQSVLASLKREVAQ